MEVTRLRRSHLQDVLLRVACQQFSQAGVRKLLQCVEAEASLQTTHVDVDQTFLGAPLEPPW